MRLKAKITALLIPMLLVQFIAVLIPASIIYQNYFKEQVQSHIDDTIKQLDNAYNTNIENLSSDSLIFSQSHSLERYLRIEDQSVRFRLMHQNLLFEFNDYQRIHPNYFEISLIAPDGYEEVSILNSGVINKFDEEQDSSYFKSALLSTKKYDVFIDINPDDQNWAMIAVRKIYLKARTDHINQGNRLTGLLVIKSNLSFLTRQFASSNLSNKGHLVLYHNDGRIIWQSKHASKISEQHLQLLRGAQSVQPILAGYPVELKAGTDNDAQLLIQGQKQLQYGLNLSVAWPETDLLELIKKMSLASVLLSLLLMTLSLVVLYSLLNKLLIRPISQLSQTAKSMGSNKLPSFGFNASKDELGDLYITLKRMDARLIEQKQSLHKIAYQDSLTKLPNRRRFLDYLDAHFEQSDADISNTALLFIDLDDFKQVNDSYGHLAGDQLLESVANRFRKALRIDDMVDTSSHYLSKQDLQLARLGGDEFIVSLRNMDGAESIGPIVQRIQGCMNEPFKLNDHESFITVSIGIALCNKNSCSSVELLKNADAAMYKAKQKGKNTFHYFDPSISEDLRHIIDIKNQLHKAIDNQDFNLHYQPQICPIDGSLVGIEALVRWNIPDQGWIRPDIFIPIAEKSGLIVPLGRMIMLEACRQNRQWQLEGLPIVPVSINVSNVQLAREDMLKTVQCCLDETGMTPEMMTFEVTESSIMQGERSIEQLIKIQNLGIRISLDDFGTGYSSLSALRGLPIDELKIDKSFISGLDNIKENGAIVGAIIAMAKQLNLDIVAEGVENDLELQFLVENNVDIIQGYYYSKPLSAQALKESYLISVTNSRRVINNS